jgi:hypothetical protein
MISRRDFLKNMAVVGAVGTACPALASLNGETIDQVSAIDAAGAKAPSLRYILDTVANNPGEPLFVTKYNQTAFLKSWGYNGQCPKFYLQTAIMYDRFDPTLLPKDSKERAWSENMGVFIDGRLAEAKSTGMPVYPFTDVLVVPQSLLKKYGDQMGAGGKLTILKPMTQTVMREQIAEIFERFPSLAGITTRFGETYLQDTPFHAGGSPVVTVEEHQVLINLLRDEICVKRNKVLNYRTWGLVGNGIQLHTNPASYLAVSNAVEPHPLLNFSIKHTNGDFNRGLPFNQTLGLGKHPQIVEASCNQAGCYGKNAHPYYIGQGVIDGWEEMGDQKKGVRDLVGSPQLAGIWTWSRGDGWAGPYITNEFWVDLNAYVISHFGEQPWRSEESLFEEYAHTRLKLDDQQTARLRELCLLATSATYYGQQSSFFKVSLFWCRDDCLTAINLKPVVDKGIVKEVLAEKAKAVADWRHVEELSRQMHLSNPADQEFVEVSSTYGRIKMAVIEQIWTMQILAAQGKTAGTLDVASMRQAIDAYDKLWEEWRQLKQNHSCCPTLYLDTKGTRHAQAFAIALASYRQSVKQTG